MYSVRATQQTAISLMLFGVLRRCWDKVVSASAGEEVQPGAGGELFTAGTVGFCSLSLVRMAMIEFKRHSEEVDVLTFEIQQQVFVQCVMSVQWES